LARRVRSGPAPNVRARAMPNPRLPLAGKAFAPTSNARAPGVQLRAAGRAARLPRLRVCRSLPARGPPTSCGIVGPIAAQGRFPHAGNTRPEPHGRASASETPGPLPAYGNRPKEKRCDPPRYPVPSGKSTLRGRENNSKRATAKAKTGRARRGTARAAQKNTCRPHGGRVQSRLSQVCPTEDSPT
jgi:hypothetical protein